MIMTNLTHTHWQRVINHTRHGILFVPDQTRRMELIWKTITWHEKVPIQTGATPRKEIVVGKQQKWTHWIYPEQHSVSSWFLQWPISDPTLQKKTRLLSMISGRALRVICLGIFFWGFVEGLPRVFGARITQTNPGKAWFQFIQSI